MKKSTLLGTAALVLGSVFATSTMAEEVALTACTKDGKTAAFNVNIKGSIKGGESLKTVFQTAFTKAINNLDSTEIDVETGYRAFRENLRVALIGKEVSNDADVSSASKTFPTTIGSPACSVK